jgi:tetratricopeptide (TPR) repeat protein
MNLGRHRGTHRAAGRTSLGLSIMTSAAWIYGGLVQPATPASLPSSATAIEYICGAEHRAPVTGPRRLSIESGMGSGGFSVRTGDPQAQAWFDYGLRLFHAFYHDDAKLAFDKAAERDPQCSMCLWGQALSRGSTQNYDVTADEQKSALDYARKAQAVAATQVEKTLSAALIARYSAKQDPKAETTFADSLVAAQALDPEAADINLIAAEALLTAARRGEPAAASHAVAILEPILQRDPDNTAAIHYYIHATAWTGQSARTERYAERLPDLAPKASHLVHMAAHTFLSLGRYEDAAVANARALLVDAEHAEATGVTGPLGTPPYYGHNLAFGLDAALMAGDADLAVKFAHDTDIAFDDTLRDSRAGALRYAYVALARFIPDEMLSIPAQSNGFQDLMRAYARGEAFAVKHDVTSLKLEERALEAKIARRPKVWTTETTLPLIADEVLQGRIAMLSGDPKKAARMFKKAATLQEAHNCCDEPPPWWYPVRRSLAAAYLEAGRYQEAASQAQVSLQHSPRDGLALLVLSVAEERLGHLESARQHRDEAARAWSGELDKIDVAMI